MRTLLVVICLLGAAAGLIAAGAEKRAYVQGTAGRIGTGFDALISKETVENDRLEVKNDQLDLEIDRRKHMKNDGSKLKAAIEKLELDEEAASQAAENEAATIPEDTSGELTKAGAGAVAGILGIILLVTKKNQP